MIVSGVGNATHFSSVDAEASHFRFFGFGCSRTPGAFPSKKLNPFALQSRLNCIQLLADCAG